MNKLRSEGDFLNGFCWIPRGEQDKAFAAIESLRKTHSGKGDGFIMPTFAQVAPSNYKGLSPPTAFTNFKNIFTLNDFTTPFQTFFEIFSLSR